MIPSRLFIFSLYSHLAGARKCHDCLIFLFIFTEIRVTDITTTSNLFLQTDQICSTAETAATRKRRSFAVVYYFTGSCIDGSFIFILIRVIKRRKCNTTMINLKLWRFATGNGFWHCAVWYLNILHIQVTLAFTLVDSRSCARSTSGLHIKQSTLYHLILARGFLTVCRPVLFFFFRFSNIRVKFSPCWVLQRATALAVLVFQQWVCPGSFWFHPRLPLLAAAILLIKLLRMHLQRLTSPSTKTRH